MGGGGGVGMVAEPSWVLHVSSKRHRYSIWIGPHPWPAVTPYPTGFILTLRAFSHFPSFSTLLRIPLELCRHGRGQDHDAHLWKMGTRFMSKRVSGWMKQTTASWPRSLLAQNKVNRPFPGRWSQVVAMGGGVGTQVLQVSPGILLWPREDH